MRKVMKSEIWSISERAHQILIWTKAVNFGFKSKLQLNSNKSLNFILPTKLLLHFEVKTFSELCGFVFDA